MKKRLEAELISIAHRILKLKNRSEIDQLYFETRKLYEALSILKFYGDNFEQIKTEIPNDLIENKVNQFIESVTVYENPYISSTNEVEKIELDAKIEEENLVEDQKSVIQDVLVDKNEVTVDAVSETEIENINTIQDIKIEQEFTNPVAIDYANDLVYYSKEEAANTEINTNNKSKVQEISFEDLLGKDYVEPIFVKPNEINFSSEKKELSDIDNQKSLSLNDKFSKTITIGLNDRIGFVKHLFGEKMEDYNRVLSQLNTFTNYKDAKDFIESIIKPDYNNWEGKEDYEARFIEIVEKKFL